MKLHTFAFKRVAYASVEDHLRLGWIARPPNGPYTALRYGIIMEWVCPCKIPERKPLDDPPPRPHYR